MHCHLEKLEIIVFIDQKELSNKLSEMLEPKKYLLNNDDSKDLHCLINIKFVHLP